MKHIIKQFMQREAEVHIQFIKYGIAGGIATAVDIIAFSLCAWLLLPALSESELIVKFFHVNVAQITNQLRSWHYVGDKTIAFIFFSNPTAYLIDAAWVFHPGRHARWKEFLFFSVISATAVGIGIGLSAALIRWFGIGALAAYVINVLASLSINYAGRKFFVFQR